MTLYPLSWPLSWPRRDPATRLAGRFATTGRNSDRRPEPLTLAEARARLQEGLDRVGAVSPVLCTNVPLRLDRMPRSGREPADPGAAVYFTRKGLPYCLPCDTYTRVADNVAALAAHLAATRAIERHGVVTLDRLIAVAALPALAEMSDAILLPPPAKDRA